MSSPASPSPVAIRRATAADAPACGSICFEAFATINRQHNFPLEFPSAEVATGILASLFAHPGFYCVVAEVDGKIAGSNCLDERSVIAGIGPISVDPAVQNRGIGRLLMNAVLDRTQERGFAGTRLLQAAFHSRSLSLYTKLGFAAREPVSVMRGTPIGIPVASCTVRPAVLADLYACDEICNRTHGHTRSGEVQDGVSRGSAVVVERGGVITGYATGFGYFGHTVAESMEDLKALLSSVKAIEGPGILIPTRNYELFRWCLDQGWRVQLPLTLMTIGHYREPAGPYLPSILF